MGRSTLVLIGFASAMFTLTALVHYYLWRRLVRATGLERRPRRWATATVVTLGVSIPLVLGLTRVVPREMLSPLAFVAYAWMGYVFYVVLSYGIFDAAMLPARVLGWFWPKRAAEATPAAETGPANPERRQFLARVAAGGALAGASAVTMGGIVTARGGDFYSPEVPIAMPRLPRALDGYRIVQISDIHIGPTIDGRFLDEVVEKVNALKPDLVALTGDLVDGPVRYLGEHVARLAGLKARDGVAFCHGNHEYYSGVDAWTAYLRELGLHVLDNRHMTVGDRGPGGASFDVAGVNDWTAGRFGDQHAPDLAKALAGRDPERELVLLAHQPRQAPANDPAAGVSLQLSGHTHGGQMWPFRYLVGLQSPYVTGLYQVGDGQLYVNQGTGYWGPPLRVLVPPEITTLVLTA